MVTSEKKTTTETKTDKTDNPPTAPMKDVMSNEELARDIVHKVSYELHVRTGIGPIWRQLNEARKKEIIDKWHYEVMQLLVANR